MKNSTSNILNMEGPIKN